MTKRLGILGISAVLLVFPGEAAWPAAGQQFFVGTVLGYLGGFVGAQIGAAVAQQAGWGLIDGLLAPIVCAYVGYAMGSTFGAWTGVTWTGFHLELPGDPLGSFLGASLGTGLAYLIASFADWEWALPLSPPLAALGATLAFSWHPSASLASPPE